MSTEDYITDYLETLYGGIKESTRDRVKKMLRVTTPDVVLRRLGGESYYDYNAMILRDWTMPRTILPGRFTEFFEVGPSVFVRCLRGGKGLIAKKKIPADTLYGPFFGFPEKWNDVSTHTWSTTLRGVPDASINSYHLPTITVDGKEIPNVIRFVNSISVADPILEKRLLRRYAGTRRSDLPFIPSAAQNCESHFQQARDGSDVVFYRTTRAVPRGEELVVSYGAPYLEHHFGDHLRKLLS